MSLKDYNINNYISIIEIEIYDNDIEMLYNYNINYPFFPHI